jgi:hypothetical protein
MSTAEKLSNLQPSNILVRVERVTRLIAMAPSKSATFASRQQAAIGSIRRASRYALTGLNLVRGVPAYTLSVMSLRRGVQAAKFADQFLVSVGSAVIAGKRTPGIGLQKEGELTLLFMPTWQKDGQRSGHTWLRVSASDYVPSSNPIDERLIEMPGISGHFYEIEDPS